MKSIFSGGAIIATALLGSIVVVSSARLSAAEPLVFPFQEQKQQAVQTPKQDSAGANTLASETATSGPAATPVAEVPEDRDTKEAVSPPTSYVATAYSLRGRTASGRMVSKGLIAADPRHLPLGSRVRLEAGNFSGEYLVADTGGSIRGRKIDIWTPSTREAMRFGRRTVKLTVLSYGPRRAPRTKRATR